MARYTKQLNYKARMVKTIPMDENTVNSFCNGISNMLFRNVGVKKLLNRRYYIANEQRARAAATEGRAKGFGTEAAEDFGFDVKGPLASVMRELSYTMPMLQFYPVDVRDTDHIAVFADGCDFPIGFISYDWNGNFKIVSPVIYYESRKEARHTGSFDRMMSICRKEFKMVPPPWVPMFVAGCMTEKSLASAYSDHMREIHNCNRELSTHFSNRHLTKEVGALLREMYKNNDPATPVTFKRLSDQQAYHVSSARKVIPHFLAFVYVDAGPDSVRVCMSENQRLKEVVNQFWRSEDGGYTLVDRAYRLVTQALGSVTISQDASPVIECPLEDLPDPLVAKIGKASMLDDGECVLGTGAKLGSGEYILYGGDLLRDREVYRFFFDTEA
jgi:hypothetical protein